MPEQRAHQTNLCDGVGSNVGCGIKSCCNFMLTFSQMFRLHVITQTRHNKIKSVFQEMQKQLQPVAISDSYRGQNT